MEGDEINARFREVWAELKMQSAYVRKQADRIDALEAKPQPSGNTGELTETVGERIVAEYRRTQTGMMDQHAKWISAAIDAAVQAATDRDNYEDAFDVLREDHNALCEGLNAALDAHGVKWKDTSTYAGLMESALSRAEKAEADVKRLSDPGWITHMSCHNSTYAAFARHVRGGGV